MQHVKQLESKQHKQKPTPMSSTSYIEQTTAELEQAIDNLNNLPLPASDRVRAMASYAAGIFTLTSGATSLPMQYSLIFTAPVSWDSEDKIVINGIELSVIAIGSGGNAPGLWSLC